MIMWIQYCSARTVSTDASAENFQTVGALLFFGAVGGAEEGRQVHVRLVWHAFSLCIFMDGVQARISFIRERTPIQTHTDVTARAFGTATTSGAAAESPDPFRCTELFGVRALSEAQLSDNATPLPSP